MAPINSPWTAEKIEELRQHIENKLYGSQTARAMGMPKNAIVGKAHRLGWKFLSTPGKVRKKKHQPTAAFIIQAKAKCRSIPLPQSKSEPYQGFLGISLIDLPDDACHFIEGESTSALYCGQPAKDGPWCNHHKKLCTHEIMPQMRISKTDLFRL